MELAYSGREIGLDDLLAMLDPGMDNPGYLDVIIRGVSKPGTNNLVAGSLFEMLKQANVLARVWLLSDGLLDIVRSASGVTLTPIVLEGGHYIGSRLVLAERVRTKSFRNGSTQLLFDPQLQHSYRRFHLDLFTDDSTDKRLGDRSIWRIHPLPTHRLIVAATSQSIAILDEAGECLQELPASAWQTALSVSGSSIYVGGTDGVVLQLDIKLTQTHRYNLGKWINGSLMDREGAICFYGAGSSLVFLNKAGDRRFEPLALSAGEEVWTAVLETSGGIYLGLNSGRIIYRKVDGQCTEFAKLSGAITSMVRSDDNDILVATIKGEVFTFGARGLLRIASVNGRIWTLASQGGVHYVSSPTLGTQVIQGTVIAPYLSEYATAMEAAGRTLYLGTLDGQVITMPVY